jgi:hypothetical protein
MSRILLRGTRGGAGVSSLPILTSSRLRVARACQRLHKFEYFDGYRPVADPDAIRFGRLFDEALQAWWTASGEERLDAALATLSAASDPFDAAKADALLRGYHLRWGAEPYDVLAVQPEFRAPLVNPATGRASQTWQIGGKLDVIVRDRNDGRTLIVEGKTTSEPIAPGSDYWRRLRLNGQVSMYYEGAKALGHDVAACLYDVVFKPGLRPLKVNQKRKVDETPDEYRARIVESICEDPSRYYARAMVVRLEAEMEDHLFDVWQTAQQIRESELAGRFPKNPDSCLTFGRSCPFLGVCSGEASLDDPSLFTKSADVHPELSATKPANGDSKEENQNGSHEHSTDTAA